MLFSYLNSVSHAGNGGYGGYKLYAFLYSMKPINESIPIRELQTLLRVWRRRGLNEATLIKVLELYLGQLHYMNERGEYPVHFFYDLSLALRFRTVTYMVEAMKQSGSFGWRPGDNKVCVDCFWSPLWKEVPPAAPSQDIDREKCALLPANLPANLQADNNIYNFNNLIFNSSSPEETPGNPSEEGRKFFQTIKRNPAEKAEVLNSLIDYFMRQEPNLPREEACCDVVYLVNELLIPHFAAQEKFLHMSHKGRLAWLKNLLKTTHGRELLKRAAEAGHLRRSLEQQQKLTEVRLNNRPLSPYEWMDPETGTRFYEDTFEGQVTIPPEAPPRPDEGAFWNVLQQKWGS